jgi:hypothetical protein
VEDGLQAQVKRLNLAFDAFVEISDRRHEMAGFVDADELRRYAGRVLAALASGTRVPTPGSEVPGYWLAPAVEALIALHSTADGLVEDTPADGPLTEAMALDERRTTTFLVLALAALGRRNLVRPQWVDAAFGVPATDGTLTRSQRALWMTAARGGFGADGLALIVQRLRSAAPPAEGWLAKLASRADDAARTEVAFAEVAEQEHARVRLARLRTAITAITGNPETREPDRDLAYAAEGEPAPDNAAALLRLLISEGSEPEREPLARMVVLRARITGDEEVAAPAIDDPVGTVEELLHTDLGRTDEPHAVAAALQVIGPAILPGAEELAATAAQPGPREIVLENGLRQVIIRPDGPDQSMLAKAEASIDATAEQPNLTVPAVLAGAGALTASSLGFVHPLWILGGLVLLAGGAFYYWNLRVRAGEAAASVEDQIARLGAQCAESADGLAAYLNQSDERQAAIANDLAEIRRLLTD